MLGSSLLLALRILGLLALGAVFAVLLPGCAHPGDRTPGGDAREWEELKQEIRRRFPRAPRLSTEELAERLAGGAEPAPLLLDARAPEEYAVSHLPGAVSAPDVETALAAIADAGAQRPVVVYCSVGWRSGDLAQRLRDRGIEEVWNLEGSIFEWANEGRPVVRDGAEVRRVHPYDERWGRFLDRELWAFSPGATSDGEPP